MLNLDSRIGVIGDVHGNNSSIMPAIWELGNLGVRQIIAVGDCWFYTDPRQLKKISRHLRRYGASLYFLDGNHEDFGYLGDRIHRPGVHRIADDIYYLGRGTRFKVGTESALALGGAVSRDRLLTGMDALGRRIKPRVEGIDWWPDEAIADVDVNHALDGEGSVDIMFTHDAPTEALRLYGLPPSSADDIVVRSEEIASRSKLDAVVKALDPSLLIHGHLHISKVVGRYIALDRDRRPGHTMVLDVEELCRTN